MGKTNPKRLEIFILARTNSKVRLPILFFHGARRKMGKNAPQRRSNIEKMNWGANISGRI
ncbi:MAG TPA: hypothetical protein DCL41_09080 [Bdellovibrionales bacterium]|nr:hypothetical protein [Pseudobdellovibrionaceae bacterium]HAG92013.1 hypothetical protein [Bdellovibrionales bacterium]